MNHQVFNYILHHWPQSLDLSLNVPEEKWNDTSLLIKTPVIPIDRYSSFNHLKRITGLTGCYFPDMKLKF